MFGLNFDQTIGILLVILALGVIGAVVEGCKRQTEKKDRISQKTWNRYSGNGRMGK